MNDSVNSFFVSFGSRVKLSSLICFSIGVFFIALLCRKHLFSVAVLIIINDKTDKKKPESHIAEQKLRLSF